VLLSNSTVLFWGDVIHMSLFNDIMRFDILTIFPFLFDSYLEESLIKKAREKGSIEVNVHDLRKWSVDKHGTVDDKPFGGGSGMVMRVEPIYRAVCELKEDFLKKYKNDAPSSRVILFTPRGKRFNQKKADDFTNYKQMIIICGRYEGVDERVAKYIADERISIGNYVLMGGELPAMVVLETVSRLVPGVVGKESFLKERRKEGGFVEYPQYTRPENVTISGKKRRVPGVLLSGDHKRIEEWRKEKKRIIN